MHTVLKQDKTEITEHNAFGLLNQRFWLLNIR